MSSVRITFLGSGDAFASGGRFHTCMLVQAGADDFLVDCGASAITAMQQRGVRTDSIGAVFLSHLHGDHFGGLPYVIMDAHFVCGRKAPLLVTGPPGTRVRMMDMMEALYPGAWATGWRFPLEIVELEPAQPHRVGGVTVTPYLVQHESGAPPFALRFECCGKAFAYSGDTEWTDTLIDASRGTDLMICECNSYDRKIRYHTDLPTLVSHRAALDTRRLILTHLGPAMLAHRETLPFEYAEDGMVVTL
ncbi:MAG TPA: MBL fold metallo-hydrolase [bacterium]|nr:MBL fold metallo-hydrolase [bacterium]